MDARKELLKELEGLKKFKGHGLFMPDGRIMVQVKGDNFAPSQLITISNKVMLEVLNVAEGDSPLKDDLTRMVRGLIRVHLRLSLKEDPCE